MVQHKIQVVPCVECDHTHMGKTTPLQALWVFAWRITLAMFAQIQWSVTDVFWYVVYV